MLILAAPAQPNAMPHAPDAPDADAPEPSGEGVSEADRAFLRAVAEGRRPIGAPGTQERLEEIAGRVDEHADPTTRALLAAAVERFEDGVLVLADAVLARVGAPPGATAADADAPAPGPHSLGEADRLFLENVRDGATDPEDAHVLPRLQDIVRRAEGSASDASRRLVEAALTAYRAALVAGMRQALGPAAPDR